MTDPSHDLDGLLVVSLEQAVAAPMRPGGSRICGGRG